MFRSRFAECRLRHLRDLEWKGSVIAENGRLCGQLEPNLLRKSDLVERSCLYVGQFLLAKFRDGGRCLIRDWAQIDRIVSAELLTHCLRIYKESSCHEDAGVVIVRNGLDGVFGHGLEFVQQFTELGDFRHGWIARLRLSFETVFFASNGGGQVDHDLLPLDQQLDLCLLSLNEVASGAQFGNCVREAVPKAVQCIVGGLLLSGRAVFRPHLGDHGR